MFLSDQAMVTLWTRMEEIYPHRWISKLGEPGSSAFETWRQGLAGMTPEQLKRGLQQCLQRRNDWPPTLPEFRRLCQGSPQSLGLPTLEDAFRMAFSAKSRLAPVAFHILRDCLQKILSEDFEALRGLGLSFETLRRLEALTVKELVHLSRLGPRFLGITLDPQELQRALQHTLQEADREAMQDEMLLRRAPFPMMQTLFGMTSVQYTNRRKLLGLAYRGVGRPPSPTEAEHRQVWQAWQQQAALSERCRYLMVSRLTQVNLHIIWNLVKAWQTTAPGCAAKPWSLSE